MLNFQISKSTGEYIDRAAREFRRICNAGEMGDVMRAAVTECERAGWHFGTAVRGLAEKQGITYRTAEHLVEAVFNCRAARR